ncbi:GSCOCG00001306001-RA-CDS, partial [Cotesia congregata]
DQDFREFRLYRRVLAAQSVQATHQIQLLQGNLSLQADLWLQAALRLFQKLQALLAFQELQATQEFHPKNLQDVHELQRILALPFGLFLRQFLAFHRFLSVPIFSINIIKILCLLGVLVAQQVLEDHRNLSVQLLRGIQSIQAHPCLLFLPANLLVLEFQAGQVLRGIQLVLWDQDHQENHQILLDQLVLGILWVLFLLEVQVRDQEVRPIRRYLGLLCDLVDQEHQEDLFLLCHLELQGNQRLP